MTIYQSKSPKPHQPYLYIIGWSSLDKWYIGIQHGQKAHPSNLWVSYFTSSPIVKQFRKEHGEPDYFQTLVMSSAQEAIDEEIRYLTECDVLNSNKWLNGSIGRSIAMTDEVRSKIRDRHIGRKYSPETIVNMSNGAKNRKPISDETRRKLQDNARNRSDETKRKISQSKIGHIVSEETRQKISQAALLRSPISDDTRNKMSVSHRKPKPLATCPHCKQTGGQSQMTRWHFDNCKRK